MKQLDNWRQNFNEIKCVSQNICIDCKMKASPPSIDSTIEGHKRVFVMTDNR